MTREEAEGTFGYTECAEEVMVAIESIYDDFESRTCDNCRHSNQTSYALYCRKDVKNLTIGVDKDFGCNKFEKAEK